MIQKLFLLFLYIYIFPIVISNEYNYESIKEFAPHKFIFNQMNNNSFKIFEYIPFCNNNLNSTKNIYVHVQNSQNDLLYLYDDYSKIKQNERGYFINYNGSNIIQNTLLKFENLICKKKYYFVIYKYENILIPSFVKLFIIDKECNNITLSPSLSQNFNFLKKINNIEDTFNYYYNKTKLVLINLKGAKHLKILENNKTIYDNNETNSLSKIFEFKKYTYYYILYNASHSKSQINFQFLDESKFIKHNFNKEPFILLNEYKYYFEIDLSDYKIGDYIVISVYGNDILSYIILKYQYKNKFKENNLINLGKCNNFNYIPIKKEVEDSLILYIESHTDNFQSFNMLDIFKNKVQEITTENNLLIKEPTLLFINCYSFNDLNSFIFYSNNPYYSYEQGIFNEISTSYDNVKYKNITIIDQYNNDILTFKRILILFNSKNESTFEIKKLNYPILNEKSDRHYTKDQYFQLCQGNNSYNELYFHINNEIYFEKGSEHPEAFNSIFGNYDSFFINEDNIKTISDFDFNKIDYINNLKINNKNGYLKIKCKEPTMIKHMIQNGNYKKHLNTGKRYFIVPTYEDYSFTFNEEYINKNISLKFIVYGLQKKETIKLIIDNNIYNLNNEPFEINIFYEKYDKNLIIFNFDKNIFNHISIEIIVGFIQEDLDKFKQIDFIESFGELQIEGKKGVIIKIPEDFNENLYNFSIISPNRYSFLDIQIVYDKIEFAVPRDIVGYLYTPSITPLFNINPYSIVSKEELSTDKKFFFITIYNDKENSEIIFIKKSKIYSDIQLNKINILPKLIGDDKKYYYKIEIPKGDYNILLVQSLTQGENYKNSLFKNNIYYSTLTKGYFINFPINKNDYNSSYINYYDTSDTGFINFIIKNEFIFKNKYNNQQFNPEISQIKGTNKLKIKMNSLSYYDSNIYNYYFIINIDDKIPIIYSVIFDHKRLDASQKQQMIIVEDDGTKEIVEYEIKIDIELYNNPSDNIMVVVPVQKEINIINFECISKNSFSYIIPNTISKNYENNSFSNFLYILGGIILIILIIIVIIVIIFFLKKNKNTNDRVERNALNEELNNIDNK